MNKYSLLILALFLTVVVSAQNDSVQNIYQNTASKLLSQSKGLTLGGYAQIDYNQPFEQSTKHNGELDVHRLVMLLGYNFNSRLQFVSEIEYEHVQEVYVEQAFLQYRINNYINLRGGLLLIPMGIINEYHEPPSFNGVERPYSDYYIAPTTWREVGFGITGNIIDYSLRYQAYVVNGFNGYDGSATFSAQNGLRKGRQKGAESYMSSPNFTAKVEYYGLKGLNLGLAGYFGSSQSTALDGLQSTDIEGNAFADSTVIGISMLGFDARYNSKGFQFRGQLYYTQISNSEQYNQALNSDIGSVMMSYYFEMGYNVFHSSKKIKSELIPFARYETFDTQHKVTGTLIKNDFYNKQIYTFGLGWKINSQVAIKADVQFMNNQSVKKYTNMFNAGIGVMF